MRYFVFPMRTKLMAALACLAMVACQRSDVKVLIGATTMVAPGAAPIEDSVIVVAGGRIRSVGIRKDVPIPQDSERVDVTGKRIVPVDGARIEVNQSADLIVTGNGSTRRMMHGQWQ
jgi:adenine deaminase